MLDHDTQYEGVCINTLRQIPMCPCQVELLSIILIFSAEMVSRLEMSVARWLLSVKVEI